MCVGSWAAFYLFEEEREQGIGRKKGGDSHRRPGVSQCRGQGRVPSCGLEDELQSELHDTRVMRVCRGEEIARTRWVRGRATEGSPDVIELCMVEGIVGFPAEFDRGRFLDGELLKKAHIEIGAVGPVQGVPADISERQSTRCSKRAGIEEQRA